MKKMFLSLAIICGALLTSQAQLGVKGGLNFSSNGKLKDVTNEIKADSKVGYHVGVFYQTKGDGFYLRPEIVYTKTKSSYNATTGRSEFDMSKVDVPILLGYHVFKPISVFAGPSLQYILDTDLKGFDLNDAKDNFTVGIQFGAAVELGEKLGVDLRYEKGLSNNLAEITGVNEGRLDTRPTQLILGLSYKF